MGKSSNSLTEFLNISNLCLITLTYGIHFETQRWRTKIQGLWIISIKRKKKIPLHRLVGTKLNNFNRNAHNGVRICTIALLGAAVKSEVLFFGKISLHISTFKGIDKREWKMSFPFWNLRYLFEGFAIEKLVNVFLLLISLLGFAKDCYWKASKCLSPFDIFVRLWRDLGYFSHPSIVVLLPLK